MTIFIDDGYTRKAYFAPSSGTNLGGMTHTDEFRFSYRPALPEERGRVLDECQKFSKTEDIEKVLAKSLAPKIVSWDLKLKNGDAVPISVKNVLRLEQSILSRMVNVVLYRKESGDIDPEANKSEQDEQARDLESAIGDQQKN